MNVGVVLASRPHGWVTEDCFRVEERPVPSPGEGEVVVRNIYVSIDPYLRGRMNEAFALNAVVPVRGVGQVAASRNRRWKEGDLVWGFLGWEQWTLVHQNQQLWPVNPALGPISRFISVLGMPGLTAWVGMYEIGLPRPCEHVLISSAAGAVGSVAGQLARLSGCRVVGTVGSDDKAHHVTSFLRFDEALNYRTVGDDLRRALRTTFPHGIDIYFENVGGSTLEAVLVNLADRARVPVCGMIAGYNELEDAGIRGLINVLAKRATLTGFSIYDWMHLFDTFQPAMAELLADDRVRYHEEIWEGVEQAPAAFVGMLKGDSLGKRLVRVGDDPTG